MNLSSFIDWITLRDYDTAKAAGVRRVVSRFIRGNVRAQSGHYLTEAEATEIERRGDKAMERLDRAANAR
jgi:hypothetical protein